MSSDHDIRNEVNMGNCADQPSNRKAVSATVLNENNEIFEVEVFELAPVECKFVVSAGMPVGTKLTLIFHASWNDGIRAAAGRVHWCREVKGEWHVGVFLDAHFPTEFAPAMGEDVRLSLRYEVWQAATVRFLPRDEVYPVVIEDYSGSGLCCSIKQEDVCVAGDRFELLQTDANNETRTHEGCVTWVQSASVSGRSLFGATMIFSDLPLLGDQ